MYYLLQPSESTIVNRASLEVRMTDSSRPLFLFAWGGLQVGKSGEFFVPVFVFRFSFSSRASFAGFWVLVGGSCCR